MAVTEFAFLTLKSQQGCPADLLALLEQAQQTQDDWRRTHDPSFSSDRTLCGTTAYQQLEDPSVLLLTAQWASPDAHGDWIASDENRAVMAGILRHLDDDVAGQNVTLFHVDAEIFTGKDAEAKGQAVSVGDAPVLSVSRFQVGAQSKDGFQRMIEGSKWVVEQVSKPYPVRGGWRIERDEGDEFVMVCGWDSVEQHTSVAHHESWAEWAKIKNHASAANVKHYKRIA